MLLSNLQIGTKIQIKRDAALCFGNGNNPVTIKEIEKIHYTDEGSINFFTFKGMKSLYRFVGENNAGRIYSITGPLREYKIIE